jgi:TP53 regulating kinase and related kinases
MKQKIIQQGAEAVISRQGNFIVKNRVVKGYRLKELDDTIRRRRTRREWNLLEKAGKIINVPKVEKVDKRSGEIEMEFIDGMKLSDNLDEMKNWKEICMEIGRNIGKLHNVEIIHGDLTTSNMIWVGGKGEGKLDGWKGGKLDSSNHIGKVHSVRKISRNGSESLEDSNVEDDNNRAGGKLYFIDFGLGFGNGRVEDKAVDLHLIKRALEAKHFKRFEEYFQNVLKGYEESKDYDKVMTQFVKVEKRGRYKMQY